MFPAHRLRRQAAESFAVDFEIMFRGPVPPEQVVMRLIEQAGEADRRMLPACRIEKLDQRDPARCEKLVVAPRSVRAGNGRGRGKPPDLLQEWMLLRNINLEAKRLQDPDHFRFVQNPSLGPGF